MVLQKNIHRLRYELTLRQARLTQHARSSHRRALNQPIMQTCLSPTKQNVCLMVDSDGHSATATLSLQQQLLEEETRVRTAMTELQDAAAAAEEQQPNMSESNRLNDLGSQLKEVDTHADDKGDKEVDTHADDKGELKEEWQEAQSIAHASPKERAQRLRPPPVRKPSRVRKRGKKATAPDTLPQI